MDPADNTMQNLNTVPGGATPDAGAPMGQDAGMNMDGMAAGGGQMASEAAPVDNVSSLGLGNADGAQMGGNPMGAAPMGSSPMDASLGGGMPMQGMPVPGGVPPVQQPGAQMSPGQMFQAGGVAAPMGALGAIPGDYSNSNSPLLGATDPITMPAPPKAPDPVEMELNAPFKAAAPVPGSIGSAISMPGDPNQVPNVAFNDPAMMAPNSSMMPKKKSWSSMLGMDGGKKMDKKTMIILGSIVAVVIVAVIAVVVIAL